MFHIFIASSFFMAHHPLPMILRNPRGHPMQFEDRAIKSLKPKSTRYDFREKSGNGFAIRVFPSGEKSWIFLYTFEGRKRRLTLGKYPTMSLAKARQSHRDALSVLTTGKDPGLLKKNVKIEARDSSTVNGLINEYIEMWAKPNKRSWEEDKRILMRNIEPIWGNRKAASITRRDVIVLLDGIKERGAPIAANRTLACIRRMFNFAIERDLISASPCAAIKAPSKENQCTRCLTVDEIRFFWNSLSQGTVKMSPQTKLALKLQLVTAQRKGEVIGAEWKDMDLINRVWTIPAAKAKNNNLHRVPLSYFALELLREIKKLSGNSKWLFPAARGDKPITGEAIAKALLRSFPAIGTEPFTPHDIRRTGATHMTAMGISRLVVSKILNHTDNNSITAIYDRHSYDAEKRLALEAWSLKLSEIYDGKRAVSNIINLNQSVNL
jgi:integrase